MLRRKKTVDIDTAVEILSTKKQKKYTAAFRSGQGLTANLVSHVLVCPYCSHEFPAYARYINTIFKTDRLVCDRTSKDIIEKWGSKQMSMFEPPCTDLYLNNVCKPTGNFTCTKCGRESESDIRNRNVIIQYSKKTIKISCEVLGIDELLSLQWLSSGRIAVVPPLYETVTFNFRNGHTFVGLEDVDGNKVAVRDITDEPDILGNGTTNRIITTNVKSSRILRRLFMKMIGSSLPFYGDEWTFENLVLMTRFVGYDRSFYDAVPYAENGCGLEDSFKHIASELHTKESAEKYFKNSVIPDVKSIRRIYFQAPGLLFYLLEGKLLWKAIDDPNLFCKVLGAKHIYDILSELHQRPMVSEFLLDYGHEKGKATLVKKLIDEWYPIKHYAVSYCSLSVAAKIAERKTWHLKKHFCRDEQLALHFSRPLCKPEIDIEDCKISGFDFYWLRTSRDYNKAAQPLNNCLSNWIDDNNPVVCVRKDGHIIAAIEVQNNTVVQIQGIGNASIDRVSGLPEAYKKWKCRYKLTEQEDLYEFEEDDL